MENFDDNSTGRKTSDYYYDLPQELIAQDPSAVRDQCRLMCVDRKSGAVQHLMFHDVLQLLHPGDTLVLNDTKVIPARLLGTKEDTGAHMEILLLKRISGDVWETLVRPGKKLRPGAVVVFGKDTAGGGAGAPLLRAKILDVTEGGNRLVQFEYEGIFEEVLDRLGEMPLPPYITKKPDDPSRYQTVYARVDGSAAAPTAGLHFTEELLDEIEAKGVHLAWVTLHVGLGTFRPVRVEDVTQHHMHEEWYRVPAETAELINRTHAQGGRVVCVGTTSCRTVESAARWPQESLQGEAEGLQGHGVVMAGEGNTSIFIYPGYRFRVMDALITNFHLPESTLLMLVSAFAGRGNMLRAYETAVRERYRFFSFGDAMFIASGLNPAEAGQTRLNDPSIRVIQPPN